MSHELPTIECVQVVYPNGDHVYEPLADYARNPAPGTSKYTIGIDTAGWVGSYGRGA